MDCKLIATMHATRTMLRLAAMAGIAGLITGAMTGCASAPHATVIGKSDSTAEAAPADEIAFWNRIDSVPMVSNADGVYAMLVYTDADTAGDYATRVSRLRGSGLLPNDFSGKADEAMDRGTIAQFVNNVLKLPRGVSASVFGLSGRYAIRELEFRGLLPSSSANQLVSGGELIGILARADTYGQTRDVTPSDATPSTPQTADIAPASADTVAAAGKPVPNVQFASLALDRLMMEPASQPATVPASSNSFVVRSVKGNVAVRLASSEKFVTATVGLEIGEGSEITTTRKASVVLSGPGDQTITLNAFTRGRLRQVQSENGLNVTRVELLRGEVGAEASNNMIEGAGQKYDVQVESPRSTLAIKGTRVALNDQRPFDVEARSFTGTAAFDQFQRRRVAFGRKNGGLVTVTGQTPDPTGVALAAAVADPGAREARSPSEARVIANYFSRSATIRFDRFSELPTVFGGGQQSVANFFAGNLSFGINWTGQNNVNVAVFQPDANDTPSGLIYPYGKLASGNAAIPFDHRGGPNGGFEVVNFKNAPLGHYTLLAQNLGDTPTTVIFRAASGSTPLLLSMPFMEGKAVQAVRVNPGGTLPFDIYFGEKRPDIDLPGGGSLPDPDAPVAARATASVEVRNSKAGTLNTKSSRTTIAPRVSNVPAKAAPTHSPRKTRP